MFIFLNCHIKSLSAGEQTVNKIKSCPSIVSPLRTLQPGGGGGGGPVAVPGSGASCPCWSHRPLAGSHQPGLSLVQIGQAALLLVPGLLTFTGLVHVLWRDGVFKHVVFENDGSYFATRLTIRPCKLNNLMTGLVVKIFYSSSKQNVFFK